MRSFILSISAAALCTGIAYAVPDRPAKAPAKKVDKDANPKVNQLFQAMKGGKNLGFAFSQLEWKDIPALLKRIDSTAKLKTYPTNPLSSYAGSGCSEGMVALWLIEGVRKGGRYPSLNPLCFRPGLAVREWDKASEDNHAAIAARYKAWWSRAKSLPQEKAMAIDPLEGAGIAWH